MHRLLERLDASASTLVPLLYLFGLMLGAASYFAGITLNLGLAVGLALAGAAELHSFLQQRRARAAWAHLSRLSDTDADYEQARHQFKVNAWILVGLLVFSGFNATMFAVETWTPGPGPLAWLIVQYGIRGLIIPIFFFLAGFLVPLQSDASDQLRATSAEMLRRTLKAIDRQWRDRLKRAQKRNADLAPIAIALFQEAGDLAAAKRLQLIAQGLHASETGQAYTLATLETTPALTSQSPQSSQRLTATQMGIAAENTVHMQPLQPAAFQQGATLPQMPAMSSGSSGSSGSPINRTMSRREQRRLALERDMYGVRGHPTSPRDAALEAALDADDLSALDELDELDDLGELHALNELSDASDDWQAEDERLLRNGHLPEMRQHSGRRERAQAAHIAPRAATLTVREFVMPDLPPSAVEREDDSDHARAVFRVLEQDPRATRRQVMDRAGVSDGTARRYIAFWNERRSKRGKRRVAPRTQEMPAISAVTSVASDQTPDLQTATR